MIGTIKTLMSEKGFGFIRGTDNNEYFFHRSACIDEFDRLTNGKKVEFDVTSSAKGPRAENVRLI